MALEKIKPEANAEFASGFFKTYSNSFLA